MPDPFLDPKWLELLKASRPQAAAVAVACLCLLLAPRWGITEPLPQWVIVPAFFGGVLTGGLALFSFLSSAYKFFPLHVWFLHWRKLRLQKQATVDYIPHMTEKEREIIAYLLHHNQKVILAELDGGYAASLISRRILIRALQSGQAFDQNNTPFTIEDHVWDALVEHKDKFPYKSPRRGENDGHPWRIPWMAR